MLENAQKECAKSKNVKDNLKKCLKMFKRMQNTVSKNTSSKTKKQKIKIKASSYS